MNRSGHLRQQAVQDIEQAVLYYREEGGSRLALSFVDQLQDGIDLISAHPGLGSPHYAAELDLPGLRAHPLHRFPHILFYFEVGNGADIWRLLHSRRDIPASLVG
jgi:toxin ParE1/3/4